MENILYHNPRCSKSRAALELLETKGFSFEVKEYLKEPLTLEEIQSIFHKLKISSPCEGMIRTKEFPDTDFSKLSDQEIFKFITINPIVLERPIFVTNDSAVIGRPTEQLAIFLAK